MPAKLNETDINNMHVKLFTKPYTILPPNSVLEVS